MASRLGLPGGIASGLISALDGLCLLRQAGALEHLAAVAEMMHHTTDYAVQGSLQVVETRCCTRPGDRFGDFVFLFLLTARLGAVEAALQERNVASVLEWDGARTLAALADGVPAAVQACVPLLLGIPFCQRFRHHVA